MGTGDRLRSLPERVAHPEARAELRERGRELGFGLL